jgi:hypothetical protein
VLDFVSAPADLDEYGKFDGQTRRDRPARQGRQADRSKNHQTVLRWSTAPSACCSDQYFHVGFANKG